MSLNSVGTEIWNEIAETQQLKTVWAKKAFRMTSDQMCQQVSEEYEKLKAAGVPHAVASAFLDVKPLLLENEAISRHIVKTNSDFLRSALPEVVSVDEAVMLASMDSPLTISQQKQLAQLLRAASS